MGRGHGSRDYGGVGRMKTEERGAGAGSAQTVGLRRRGMEAGGHRDLGKDRGQRQKEGHTGYGTPKGVG